MKRFLILLAVLAAAAGQTRVSEEQMKLKIRVVERQKCIYTSPDGKVSCVGLELYRFLMSDGSIYGPIIGSPVPPDYQHDPTKWEKVSE